MEVSFLKKKEEKKSQIIFVLGGPGSGKGTQCERLVRDFKFHHISVGDLLRREVNNGTEIGKKVDNDLKNGKIVPTEISATLLLKEIKGSKDKRFLVDGFPRELDQAVHIENNFREIDCVLNFTCDEDTLVSRLMERGKTSGRSDDNEESIRKRLRTFEGVTKPVLDYYWRFGRVENISAIGQIEDVYNRVLPVLSPNIIYFYGGPCLGKTMVARSLAKRIDYQLLELNVFYQSQGLNTSEKKMNALIEYLSNHSERNFVVDSFFENKKEINIFFEHFAKPYYVIYFDATKDEVENNILSYSPAKDHANHRKNYSSFVESRGDIIKFLRGKPYFQSFNPAGLSLKEIENKVISIVAPKVYVAKVQDKNLFSDYVKLLEEKREFIHLPVNLLVEREIERGTELGKVLKQNKGNLKPEHKSQVIQRIIFRRPMARKFILTDFPDKLEEFEVFEQNCCKVDYLISFLKKNERIPASNQLTPETYFHKHGKHLVISSPHLELLDLYIAKRNNYGFVIGAPGCGKTSVAKHVSQKFDQMIIEWEPFIEKLKIKLGNPDEPLEEVPYPKLVDYLKNMFDEFKNKEVVLFDSFPYDFKELPTLINLIGKPSFVIIISASKEAAVAGHKRKNEMEAAAELNEEELEKIENEIKKVNQFSDYFKQLASESFSTNIYEISAGVSLPNLLKHSENLFFKRVFTCNSFHVDKEHESSMSKVYNSICARYKIEFIDVPELLRKELSSNGEFAKQLKSQYLMRWTTQPEDYPSNYTPDLILRIIKRYLSSLPVVSRDVFLFGYPAGDSKKERASEEQIFPRVLDEISAIESSLGPIRVSFILTYEPLDSIIDDPVEEIPKEEPKPIVASDNPEDGDDPANNNKNNAADADEDGPPKFDPTKYSWTVSDGKPKDIAKIYNELKIATPTPLVVDHNNFSTIDSIMESWLKAMDSGEENNYFSQILLQK